MCGFYDVNFVLKFDKFPIQHDPSCETPFAKYVLISIIVL